MLSAEEDPGCPYASASPELEEQGTHLVPHGALPDVQLGVHRDAHAACHPTDVSAATSQDAVEGTNPCSGTRDEYVQAACHPTGFSASMLQQAGGSNAWCTSHVNDTAYTGRLRAGTIWKAK